MLGVSPASKDADANSGIAPQLCPRAVSFDYGFISELGDVTIQAYFDTAGAGAAKILIVRDSRSKSVFAHAVPAKGLDEQGYVVGSLVT